MKGMSCERLVQAYLHQSLLYMNQRYYSLRLLGGKLLEHPRVGTTTLSRSMVESYRSQASDIFFSSFLKAASLSPAFKLMVTVMKTFPPYHRTRMPIKII